MQKLGIVSLSFYLVIASYSCNMFQKLAPNPQLAERLKKAVTENETGLIAFDTVFKKNWDVLCIVKAFSSPQQETQLRDRISNFSQLDLSENRYTDGLSYLIFISNNRAVDYLKIQDSPCCYFNEVKGYQNPVFLDKASAVFRIIKQQENEIVSYELRLKTRNY